jgi:hypothetical protein
MRIFWSELHSPEIQLKRNLCTLQRGGDAAAAVLVEAAMVYLDRGALKPAVDWIRLALNILPSSDKIMALDRLSVALFGEELDLATPVQDVQPTLQ